MQKIKRSDLKAALIAASYAEFANVPPEKSLSYNFSPDFVDWAKDMISPQPVITKAITFKRVAKIILIAALIAVVFAGSVLAIPAVRDAVRRHFVRQEGNMQYIDFGDYTSDEPRVEYTKTTEIAEDGTTVVQKEEITLRAEVEYTNEQPSEESGPPIPIEYRTPTYIPEGLVLESKAASPFTISFVMRGPNGLKCDYKQTLHPKWNMGSTTIALGSDYIHSETVICGMLIDEFRSDCAIVFIWSDESYLYRLLVNADMPMDEIVKIVSSIEPRDDLNTP